MDSYKVKYAPPDDEPDGDRILAITRTPTYRVSGHFAVRPVYYRHPAGEDLFMEAAVLDHIPSGYRAYGGDGWSPSSPGQCEAFAASLATMPVDWSNADMGTEAGLALHRSFYGLAQEAAARGETVRWGREGGIAPGEDA